MSETSDREPTPRQMGAPGGALDAAEANGHAGEAPDFDALYRPLLREAFVAIVRDALAAGADPAEQARAYAERGKPDFALAYLLVSSLGDDEKRDLYAQAHERRAINTERRAKEYDRSFHRPFPLLATEAANDRALARQIRAGRAVKLGARRQLPLL